LKLLGNCPEQLMAFPHMEPQQAFGGPLQT
jgi:hypothetical protein